MAPWLSKLVTVASLHGDGPAAVSSDEVRLKRRVELDVAEQV